MEYGKLHAIVSCWYAYIAHTHCHPGGHLTYSNGQIWGVHITLTSTCPGPLGNVLLCVCVCVCVSHVSRRVCVQSVPGTKVDAMRISKLHCLACIN